MGNALPRSAVRSSRSRSRKKRLPCPVPTGQAAAHPWENRERERPRLRTGRPALTLCRRERASYRRRSPGSLPGFLAIAMAASTSWTEVTQTGQPGAAQQGDAFRDDIADPVPEYLNRMGAADLHELQGSVDAAHQLTAVLPACPSYSATSFRIPRFLESFPDQVRLPQGNAAVIAGHLLIHMDPHPL